MIKTIKQYDEDQEDYEDKGRGGGMPQGSKLACGHVMSLAGSARSGYSRYRSRVYKEGRGQKWCGRVRK